MVGNLTELKYVDESRVRTAFYASDVLKPAWELYNSFTGVEKTNPPKWYETLKWGAGRGVEDQMLLILKQNGVVPSDYDQHIHGVINNTKHGVEIHGRADAITVSGLPIEIKSINNKNQWDISAYEDGYPRENYVGQLAIYMDSLGVDTGYLFVASVDGLSTFWFECTRDGDVFTCGKTKFDLAKEIARWKKLKDEFIDKRIEPDVFEYLYKIPVDKIDWASVSKDKISKARNNRAVIGDFQVQYSSWKDLWISKQGESLGYTAEELIKINEATKGYSTPGWKK